MPGDEDGHCTFWRTYSTLSGPLLGIEGWNQSTKALSIFLLEVARYQMEYAYEMSP